MRLGEAFERQYIEIADVLMREQIGEEVVTFVVPGSRWRPRRFLVAGNYLELRIRRIAGEIFVGINVFLGRMINSHHLNRVDVNDLLHRLHQEEAEDAVWTGADARPPIAWWRDKIALLKFPNHIPINLHPLHWTRNIPLVRPNPMANDSSTEHVGNKLIALSVPYKQSGA